MAYRAARSGDGTTIASVFFAWVAKVSPDAATTDRCNALIDGFLVADAHDRGLEDQGDTRSTADRAAAGAAAIAGELSVPQNATVQLLASLLEGMASEQEVAMADQSAASASAFATPPRWSGLSAPTAAGIPNAPPLPSPAAAAEAPSRPVAARDASCTRGSDGTAPLCVGPMASWSRISRCSSSSGTADRVQALLGAARGQADDAPHPAKAEDPAQSPLQAPLQTALAEGTADEATAPPPPVQRELCPSDPAASNKAEDSALQRELPEAATDRFPSSKRFRVGDEQGLGTDTGTTESTLPTPDTQQHVQQPDVQQTGHADEDGEFGSVNDYMLTDTLGKGKQGRVVLAVDMNTGAKRAIKIVQRPKARSRAAECLRREVDNMIRIRHPNVIQLHEVIDDPSHGEVYLVMEYAEGGPLATMPEDGGSEIRTVDPAKLVTYARQVCAALRYLHEQGIIHRDIKPDNILVGDDGKIRLADLGTSEFSLERYVEKATYGTLAFIAPEVLAVECDTTTPADAASRVAGEPVDVWALGITFYALLFGKLPWEFTDARELFEAIEHWPIELRPAVAAASSLAGSYGPCAGVLSLSSSMAGRHPDSHALSVSVVGSPEQAPRAGDVSPPPALAAVDPPTDAAHQHIGCGGGGTFAAMDEGWRRILLGMLQRDPRRRTPLRKVQRELQQLERSVRGAGGANE